MWKMLDASALRTCVEPAAYRISDGRGMRKKTKATVKASCLH